MTALIILSFQYSPIKPVCGTRIIQVSTTEHVELIAQASQNLFKLKCHITAKIIEIIYNI